MAFSLYVSDLSTILLMPEDLIGSSETSRKFQGLLLNDKAINTLFSNSIGIWQCSWYYDSAVRGYSIGDAVWLNTEDPKTFVQNHARLIKDYTDLNSQILNKLPEWDSKNENVISAYLNAMSGYTDAELGRDIVLPPIFDIGKYSDPIQIAVSLKDNNKDLVTETSSWKRLFVDTEEDEDNIRKLISNYEEKTLETHLFQYHLSGKENEVEEILSNFVDEPLSSMQYNELSSSMYSKYSEEKQSNGVDFVRYSIRKPIVLSGLVSQHQSARYWNSGMIEHFGIVSTRSNSSFATEDGTMLMVPFNWQIANDDSGAKAYRRGEIADSFLQLLEISENESSSIPPKDNLINVVFKETNVEVDGRKTAVPFADSKYVLTLSPIYQTQDGLVDNYIPISYAEEKFTQKWNSNYLTNETVFRKSKNYFAMRLDTRVLPPYICYYAIGKGDF